MLKKIIIAGAVIVVVYGLFSYNSFVGKNEAVDNQWAQVESQYQRRFDLIPNLVNSVKGAMAQEKAVFDSIAEARTRYAGAKTVDEKAAAAGQVETSFARLLAVMENYPTLKSIDTVNGLMAELSGTENRISVERKRFNDSVRTLNVSVKRFPSNLIAKVFSFGERGYFESAAGSENTPKVEF